VLKGDLASFAAEHAATFRWRKSGHLAKPIARSYSTVRLPSARRADYLRDMHSTHQMVTVGDCLTGLSRLTPRARLHVNARERQ